MRKTLTVATILLGLVWSGIAAAQTYPSRPITVIVPFAGRRRHRRRWRATSPSRCGRSSDNPS